MMVARIDDRPICEQTCGGFPRSINSIVNSQLDLSVVAEPADEIDFCQDASGVLDFAPSEFEAAFHAKLKRPLCFRRSWRWQVLADQFLGVIQEHAERFAAFLIL